MPESQFTIFFLGVFLGAILILFGTLLGYWWAVRRIGNKPVASAAENSGLLKLLNELSKWTRDYSGNVSRYQDQLGAASQAMQESLKSSDGKVGSVVKVLDDIMKSNSSLQQRLDDAERQLDKQKKDIESYLYEARTDALTGMPNRRAFDQRLDEMFTSWRKGSRGFVLVMIDIDHFKQINDSYGHPEGDAVLRQVAQMIRDDLEGSYIAARFGGEEFAALMPMPLRTAAERLNRFRKMVANQSIVVGELELKITISIGLSEVRQDRTIGPVVRRADEALYAAKGLGRNRVYYHDGEQPVLVGAPEVAV